MARLLKYGVKGGCAFRVLWMVGCMLVVADAHAHGPTRMKVTEKVVIDAPAQFVWSKIGAFDAIAQWHPAVQESPSNEGNQAGAVRRLVLNDGGVLREELESYSDKGMTYTYRIIEGIPDVLPVNSYKSWFRVSILDDNKSEVEWKGAFYRGFMGNNPPPELNDDASREVILAVYRSGLEGLKAYVEAAR